MTVFAVVWLVAFTAMWSILAGSPTHTLKGYPAAAIWLTQTLCGAVMAAHILG